MYSPHEKVKILNSGKIKRGVNLEGINISRSAKKAIIAKGGTVK